MTYILMNGDTPTLKFNLEEFYLEVLENSMLPYELKDYIQTTTGTSDIKKMFTDITVLKDYFVSRTINLSRDHAKAILLSANMPQSSKTEERLKIVFACRGLSMTDNFWIKSLDEEVCFSDVNLRNHKLSEASYDIAILGKHISATADELQPDLSTNGMFPKFWRREADEIYMWKTDKTSNFTNTICEIEASQILRDNHVPSVEYIKSVKGDKVFSVSKNIASDDISVIRALSIRDWCEHTSRDFLAFVEELFLTAFASMCVADYVIANTDEHIENWHFLVDSASNEIIGLAPLFDFNHALVADYLSTDIDNLIYEPTGLTFQKTIEKYARYSSVKFNVAGLPKKCKIRWKKVEQCKTQETVNSIEIF